MFDPTTTGWLTTWSILGYLLIGVAIGAYTANAIYKDGGTLADSRIFGGVTILLWPFALLIMFFGAIWYLVILKLITPKAHREKIKAEREKRKAEGLPGPGYVD